MYPAVKNYYLTDIFRKMSIMLIFNLKYTFFTFIILISTFYLQKACFIGKVLLFMPTCPTVACQSFPRIIFNLSIEMYSLLILVISNLNRAFYVTDDTVRSGRNANYIRSLHFPPQKKGTSIKWLFQFQEVRPIWDKIRIRTRLLAAIEITLNSAQCYLVKTGEKE